MRLVYMGTPQFAVPPLRALASAGHEIAGVVTRTDKPAGRGRTLAPPPVKSAAQELSTPVFQPKRVREPDFVRTLTDLAPEVIVVAAYGQILPGEILTVPRFGCINIHASLLPRYRGAAPINWAIIRGERETGITIMQMDEGMDTGAIVAQERIPIEPSDTAGSLTGKLSLLGSRMIVEALSRIASDTLSLEPQDHAKATMAPLLKKEDGLIDWTLSAQEIGNRVRGLFPWPGAYGFLGGKMVKILEVETAVGSAEPGEIVTPGGDELAAGTGAGLLKVLRLQPEGKKPMTAAEFLRGHRNVIGRKFSTDAHPRKG
jgi:methionyl-tRNA formyltransferase